MKMGAGRSGAPDAEADAFDTIRGTDPLQTCFGVAIAIEGTHFLDRTADIARATTAVYVQHADPIEVIGAEVLFVFAGTFADLAPISIRCEAVRALQRATFGMRARRHAGLFRNDGNLAALS